MTNEDSINVIRQAFYLSQLGYRLHSHNISAGWWADAISYNGTIPDKYLIPTKLCLTHSEISEAMEGERKGLPDDKLPQYPMIQVEIADAIYRLLDVATYLSRTRGYAEIGEVLNAKHEYNANRADHKIENREASGGKKF